MQLKRLLFSVLLFYYCFANINATHIVGGALAYEHLGNDIYKIKLEVLRDCQNGEAPFDNPISIGIFDTNNMLLDELLIPYNPLIEDTITLAPENIVCQYDNNLCIHRTYYQDTIELPPLEGGYQLAYQRCCRSVIISNLAESLATGMTFSAFIPSTIPNSSPDWNTEVPFGIYSNIPFVYNGSATDLDGDSLVYSLTTPSSGASQDVPMPQPPNPPPYSDAIFANGYSLDNVLSGNYPLSINSETGEFSAIPSFIGVYQIAYKVEEYREGELISTSLREFVFNVLPQIDNLNFDFNGNVLVEELNTITPIDEGKVELLQRDIETDLLTLYNETTIENEGIYQFEDVPPGVFYLKASPSPNSIFFEDYLPTYYNNSLFWYETDALNQCDTSQYYRDIYLVKADNLVSDEDFARISGHVLDCENNNLPIANLDLLLFDISTQTFKYHKTTDANGFFEFPLVNWGEYQIYVDLINSEVLNIDVPTFYVGSDATIVGCLYSDHLELEISTATEEINVLAHTLSISPNPNKGSFTIEFLMDWKEDIDVEIYNSQGQLIQKTVLTSARQDFETLEKGVLFICLRNEGGRVMEKVVVF